MQAQRRVSPKSNYSYCCESIESIVTRPRITEALCFDFVEGRNYSTTPLIRKLVIRIANYLDRLGPSSKFIKNSTKLICLEIAGHRIKYSILLWLLEFQTRHGGKV